MKKGNIAGALLGLSIAAIAVLSACSDALRAGLDNDTNDGFGNEDAAVGDTSTAIALCIATACPAPYTTCADKSGVCTTNLSNDIDHCGSCDTKCPDPSGHLDAFFVCKASRCEMHCRPRSGDCNQLVDDGCEVDLSADPKNCGVCGNACADGEICWEGACGCPPEQRNCNGRCISIRTDTRNCGGCGRDCNLPTADVAWRCGDGVIPEGAEVLCVEGQCQLDCRDARGDCNENFCGDGCETPTDADPKHCGRCDIQCTDDQACLNKRCLCEPGMTRCLNNCFDLQSDPKNCGGCGNACPGEEGPTGSPICEMGRCSYACAVGYTNCDGRVENGCEIDITTDAQNCGACNTQCDIASGQPCVAGKCLTKPCDAGVIN